jgi:hypothetical protein
MFAADADIINTIDHGIRLRVIGSGADTFASQGWIYDSGTITAVTDTGSNTVKVEDSTKTWATSPHHRWVDPVAGADGIPTWDWLSYDLIIDSPDPLYTPDPRKVIQANITGQPSSTEITVSLNVTDRITERVITALSDLVGRNYWIVRRDQKNWTRGYFDQPNDYHYAAGKVVAYDADAGQITSDRRVNAPAGAGVMFVGENGHLQRATLAGVSGNVVSIAAPLSPPVVDAWFYVVESGGLWKWGAQGGHIQRAYSGLCGELYYGHDTDDQPAAVAMPSLTYDVTYGTDPLSCPVTPESVTLYADPQNDGRHIDYWIPQDNACGDRDLYINPDVYKCLAGKWSILYAVCTSYVAPIEYTGATSIPNFSIATWLNYSGINPVSGTAGTHTGTAMPCEIATPFTPCPLHWSLIGTDGQPAVSGYTDSYNGSTINGDFSAEHDGRPVVASLGPTRYVPKRFALMFPIVHFLPDEDGGAVQARSASFPGTWEIRAASTHCRLCDGDGLVADSTEDRHAIEDDGYYRWVGESLYDPGFAVRLTVPTGPDDPLAEFHNYAYVGTRAESTQSAIQASMEGTATGGSTVRIVDTSKDWTDVDFYPSTNGFTLTGTFTAGGTTGGTAGAYAGSLLLDSFPDFPDGPYSTFTVEIRMSGSSFSDPDAVIEKRLIATGTTGAAWTWTEPTSASVNGKDFRIVEPAVLNRWASLNVPLVANAADRSVTVAWPDGERATVAILGNHTDTLFVDTLPRACHAGCTYAINEPPISGVYHRTGGQYVSTGTGELDPRFDGVRFRYNPRNNIEDSFVEYGPPRQQDAPFDPQCFAELAAGINSLKMVAIGGGWVDTTANKRGPVSFRNVTPPDGYGDWANWVINGHGGSDSSNTGYFNYNGPGDTSAPPRARWLASALYQWIGSPPSWTVTSGWTGSVDRSFNHYRITLPDNLYPKSVVFYNKAAALGTFDDEDDPVLDGAWKQWSTGGGTTGTVTSGQLGSLTPPNDSGTPPAPTGSGTTLGETSSTSTESGYEIVAAATTVEYPFPDVSLT